ncbi:MAG: flap endonuclease-1, partial [Candidatus Helarchaeota archaeon]|nr:flap endonuclease-1 [Candidatus Helarchaeota archaeon]
DSQDRITSHLSGLFFRTINLLENSVEPVYVYDGKPTSLKMKVLEVRKEKRENAKIEWESAIERGDLVAARKYAQAALFLTRDMISESKKLLETMGIPYVQSISEGESQAAHLASKGDVWASASQDWDSLLFGTPQLIRNLTITGRRKIPGTDRTIEINIEQIILKDALDAISITREQLIDIGLLIGTDFNEGISGIGPKKALKNILDNKNIEGVIKQGKIKIDFPYEEIREIFQNPEVTDDYTIKFEKYNDQKILNLLVDEHSFSENRVNNVIKRLRKVKEKKKQKSLDKWF